jgi:hypothetical protein
VLRFRHLLEKHDLGGEMLDAVNLHLEAKGIRIATGTIVDATIIHAPSSTKNEKKERDPAMHQTKKGQAVVLRAEGAHRRGQQEGTVHSVVHVGGQRVGRAHAARSAARRGAQGVGRRRLPGPDQGDPQAAPKAQDMTCKRLARLRGCHGRQLFRKHLSEAFFVPATEAPRLEVNFNPPALPGKIAHPPDVKAVIRHLALQTGRTAGQALGHRPKYYAIACLLNRFQGQFVRRWKRIPHNINTLAHVPNIPNLSRPSPICTESAEDPVNQRKRYGRHTPMAAVTRPV